MLYYFIQVFGCQMNQSDAQRIAALFEKQKIMPTDKMENADIAAVVMCSVRQMATDRVFGLEQKLKKIKAANPEFTSILTGCVVETDKPRFAKIFDHILDIKNLNRWPQRLNLDNRRANLARANLLRLNPRNTDNDYFHIAPKKNSEYSALVPISQGCDNFCSYCVVPYTRGPLKSRAASDIINETKIALKNGAKEIWLLGQNVNNYHHKNTGFAELLEMVNDIKGDFWIRFTSPHPKDFNDRAILAMAKCQKITPYLNLPVQSGDNAVLKAMARPYTAQQYKLLVKKLRTAFKKYRQGPEKEIALSTDVIVGFPGETKAQFLNTAKLFKEIKYDMAYIAQYSKRSGTAAAKLDDNVPAKEKKRREEIINNIVKTTALFHNKKYLGKTLLVLVDKIGNGFAFGKTRHYKTAKFPISSKNVNLGDIVEIKITKAMDFCLIGKLKNEK